MAALRKARHERFAELVSAGESGVDAYLGAGFVVSRKVAGVNAAKLKKRPAVKTRIEELLAQRAALAEGAADAVAALMRELAQALVDVAPNEGERARRLTWLLREGRRATEARAA